MTVTTPSWLTASLQTKDIPSSVLREMISWFDSPDKSVSLPDRLLRISKAQIDERVRRLEITKAEGKLMVSLVWREALRYSSMFVSIYLPEAVPDYDHYLGICPYCGFGNDVAVGEDKDFGKYRQYNMCCGGCGRILPFDYLATCPICNSGCSVPASETARRYMVQSDLWFQNHLYRKLEKPMETPRFDPILPFVAPNRERKIVPEGTAVVYGIYQDTGHNNFPGVEEAFLRANPPWVYILFYCPFDFCKWSVHLDLTPVELKKEDNCHYCGYPLKEAGPTPDGYGQVMRCSNKQCGFGTASPAFYREVSLPEPVEPSPVDEGIDIEEEPEP